MQTSRFQYVSSYLGEKSDPDNDFDGFRTGKKTEGYATSLHEDTSQTKVSKVIYNI